MLNMYDTSDKNIEHNNSSSLFEFFTSLNAVLKVHT